MTVEDYKNEFGTTTICKVHDDFDLQWVRQEKRDEGNLTKFNFN